MNPIGRDEAGVAAELAAPVVRRPAGPEIEGAGVARVDVAAEDAVVELHDALGLDVLPRLVEELAVFEPPRVGGRLCGARVIRIAVAADDAAVADDEGRAGRRDGEDGSARDDPDAVEEEGCGTRGVEGACADIVGALGVEGVVLAGEVGVGQVHAAVLDDLERRVRGRVGSGAGVFQIIAFIGFGVVKNGAVLALDGSHKLSIRHLGI